MVPTVDFMIMGFMRFYSKFLKTVSYSELHVVEKSSCKKTRIFKARNEIGNNEVGKFQFDTFGPSTFILSVLKFSSSVTLSNFSNNFTSSF